MGMLLGKDGKTRAIQVNTGTDPAAITTLYIGLLATLPANYDGLSLAGAGGIASYECSGWYTGRKVVTFGSVTSDAAGAIASNTGGMTSWQNLSGSTVSVAAFFITDAASGSTGSVLWVGTPDSGTVTLTDTSIIQYVAGDLTAKVD